ncbi:MAG TPA: beta-ketoacyl synthase N-terminal-like domain-containing protein [Chthoniobacteraceae bacterium]|nr:beta-ketoacyl synthase N-terminal-like domain-containing protein [Chthoniobacteraceae bacterium]
MSAKIAGMGWVTPLGTGLDEVWSRLEAGEKPVAQELTSPHSRRSHMAFTVPPKAVEELGRHPRLRRSSAISYYSVAAAQAALDHAGIAMTPEIAERTAVVFAVCSGPVIYTRRFYETVVQQGANAASPLLFPETVYNAPASHLAALLGVTGSTYTLVGDGSIGITALKFAEHLLDTGAADRCVVAAGEETDWILCEAYRKWRFPVVLAEGGAAVVLAREGRIALDPIHEGVTVFRQSAAHAAIRKVLGDLAGAGMPSLVVGCGDGTFVDVAESAAIVEFFPRIPIVYPKRTLGESLGAGALIQVVHGALALEKRKLNRVIVSALGFNQQATGLAMAPG